MQSLTHPLLHDLLVRAAGAPRRRAHHALHAGSSDPLQRFMVAGLDDTYFRPHRHLSKGELAILVHGGVDVLEFDEEGMLVTRESFGPGHDAFAWETPPGTWHTLVPRGPFAFVEVKLGPYDPATAVEYAAWAPAEGDAAVPAFRAWLADAATGARFVRS